jgi:uncharacterized protein (TIGR02678 family)
VSETVNSILDAEHEIELQRASRALLARPLLAESRHPAEYALVRRHAKALRERLFDLAGYELAVHAGWARLRKRPIEHDSTRPLRFPPLSKHARRSTSQDRWPAFDRRRYVLLALACATLCRGVQQTTIRVLVEEVAGLAADHGIPLDLYGSRDERRALASVIEWLCELGALESVEGDTEDYVARGKEGTEALFDVNGPLICDLLGARRPITEALDLERLFDDGEEYATPDERRNLRGKRRLVRRLIEEPVVFVEELTEEERAWWRTKRAWTEAQAARLCGLEIERRREGSALVERASEPRRALTDLRFPTHARESQMAVLLCEHLAGCLRAGESEVPRRALVEYAEELVGRYGRHWGAEGDPHAGLALLDAALELLAAHRLVEPGDVAVRPRAAVARFARASARRAGQPAAQETLA